MKALGLSLTLISALSGWPQGLPASELSVDLSGQFASDCRDQGKTDSCHAFASIALLEAALKRNQKEDLQLSAADLFVRKTLLKSGAQAVEIPAEEGSVDVVQIETGDPYEDIRFAIRSGVARMGTVPWESFLEAYEEYKAQRKEKCLEAFKQDSKPLAQCLAENSHLKAFLESLSQEQSLAEKEKRLLGESPEIQKDREEIRKRLEGLSVSKEEFVPLLPPEADDKGVCKEKGLKQKGMILSRLALDWPVAVCLHLEGLEGWGAEDAKGGELKHCVAVTGYKKAQGEDPLYLATRNSWVRIILASSQGGVSFLPGIQVVADNPKLYEHDLCRVHEIVTLFP